METNRRWAGKNSLTRRFTLIYTSLVPIGDGRKYLHAADTFRFYH